MEDIVILIPAYNPTDELVKIVRELKNRFKIVVVDDGSKEEYKHIFDKIQNDVILLHHDVNKGKGQALRTGLSEIEEKFGNTVKIVTADADGQHCVQDIVRVAMELKKEDCFIIGVRFLDHMPLRSKIGNKIARTLMQKKYNVLIEDTQSGLRGIPSRYVKSILKIKSEGFVFETDVLKMIFKNKIEFKQVGINTIYENQKTNFRTVVDSFKVIKAILLN